MLEFVPLTKQQIDDIFASAKHQLDYWIALYRRVYPDWDNIKSVTGYPAVSKTTQHYIWKLAIEFDQKHHPEVFAGGVWMNKGFAMVEDVADWTVVPTPAVYEED